MSKKKLRAPNPMNEIRPWIADAPTSLKEELAARFNELKALEKEQVAIGTTVPNTYGGLSAFVANPSTVSVETYQRMLDTDETLGSGIDFMCSTMISRWGDYVHPNKDIEKFVRRALQQMEGNWHTTLEEMISAEWAGFSVTEMVWKQEDDFDGAPAFVPRKLVTYQPLTIAFAVDAFGELLEDGIWQYQRYHNQYMSGYLGGARGHADLDGFRPDLYAARGDFPYPVRIAADVSLLTVRIPTSKCLHMTSTSSGKFRNPYGRSILRRIYKNWVMKDAFLKMWLVAADRKGTPLVVGYAPANDTIYQETRTVIGEGAGPTSMSAADAMAETLKKVHNSSFVVLPGRKDQDYSIDAVAVQGDMNIFLQGVEYFNKAIMRGLLIPPLVMTGGDGAGSYALGDAHKGTFNGLIDSKNKVYKQAVLNQFISKIIAYNFPRALWEKEGPGDFVIEDLDPDQMQKLADIFDRLTATGFMSQEDQEDLDHVRARFGLPKKSVKDLQKEMQPPDDSFDSNPDGIDPDDPTDETEVPLEDEKLAAYDLGDADERKLSRKRLGNSFKESDHPRANDGKFGSKPGGSSGTESDAPKADQGEKAESKGGSVEATGLADVREQLSGMHTGGAMKQWLENPDSSTAPERVTVIRQDGKIVGWAAVGRIRMGRSSEPMVSVFVADDQRGKGLGKKLVQQAVAEAGEDDVIYFDPDAPQLGQWIEEAGGDAEPIPSKYF